MAKVFILPFSSVSIIINSTSGHRNTEIPIDFFPRLEYFICMKIDIHEITRSFAPKISHDYVRNYFRIDLETPIKNDDFFAKMEELTAKAYPSSLPTEKVNDTRWEYFYLPMNRKNQLICTPIWVMLYHSLYYVYFLGINRSFGNLAVDKGNEKVLDDYNLFIDEAIRFVPLMKETNNQIVEQAFPYDYREGKIQKKYVFDQEKLMSKAERNEIETAYNQHLAKKLTLAEVSLNDYLNTAAICYQGAFQEKTRGLTPRKMYYRWADRRDFEMLDLEPDSKEEYMKWLFTKGSRGSHPFEIVYSPVQAGIHLYPPEEKKPFYQLSVANDLYNGHFIKMVAALIKHNVPFEIYGLEGILDDLTGERFIGVNTNTFDTFYYTDSREDREKYFHLIQWNEIKVLKWK